MKVLCGLDGAWEIPSEWPDLVTGCIATKLCSVIPDADSLPSGVGKFGGLNALKV